MALLLFGPAAALAAPCPKPPKPSLTVEVREGTVETDFATPLKRLQSLAAERRGPPVGPNAHALGVTESNFASNAEYSFWIARLSDGTVCAAPQSVRLRVGFPRHTIHVGRELRQDRCVFDTVLEHERRHVAVDKKALAEWVPDLRRRYGAAIARTAMVTGRSADRVSKTLEERLNKALQAELDDFGRLRDRRQATVDTPQEYARVGRACRGRAAAILREALD